MSLKIGNEPQWPTFLLGTTAYSKQGLPLSVMGPTCPTATTLFMARPAASLICLPCLTPKAMSLLCPFQVNAKQITSLRTESCLLHFPDKEVEPKCHGGRILWCQNPTVLQSPTMLHAAGQWCRPLTQPCLMTPHCSHLGSNVLMGSEAVV